MLLTRLQLNMVFRGAVWPTRCPKKLNFGSSPAIRIIHFMHMLKLSRHLPSSPPPQPHTYLLHGAESSWEANRSSASQEIPRIVWNPEGSLPHSHVPATCIYPEPDRSSSYPHIVLPEYPPQYHAPIPSPQTYNTAHSIVDTGKVTIIFNRNISRIVQSSIQRDA